MNNQERYMAAAHAMQSGVAYRMATDQTECLPKHLRVALNSAHVSIDAMFQVLLAKHFITQEEYELALANAMEREVTRYQAALGGNITLK